jgi:hypothetical protein
MSHAKTVDAMAITTESTNRPFLTEFSFVVGRLLKITSVRFLRPTRPLGAIRVPLIVGQPLPVYPDQPTSLDRLFSHNETATTPHIPRTIIWSRRNSFLDPRKLDPIEQRSYLELNQFPARDLNVRCGSRAESLTPSKSGLHHFR